NAMIAVFEEITLPAERIFHQQVLELLTIHGGMFRLQLVLTRQPNISPSAALSALVARHQYAAVVILQQVLITQPTSADRAAFLALSIGQVLQTGRVSVLRLLTRACHCLQAAP
ncbi:hypothetical protein, partial [Thiolapillus sp.]|uniref:hypothetical protein n=1 Tax=Thiolapillus sp. TaxID=2017437 RepID=UPI0025D9ADE9